MTTERLEVAEKTVKERIILEGNTIFLSLRCEHKSAEDFLHYMRRTHRVIIFDEEEDIIRNINFEEYFEKTLQVLVINGAVFQGLLIAPTETKKGAEMLGYGAPPVIIACLLLEQAFADERLHNFRFIVPIHEEVLDSVSTPCLLCVSNIESPTLQALQLHNDEPVVGMYADEENAYAFTAVPACP